MNTSTFLSKKKCHFFLAIFSILISTNMFAQNSVSGRLVNQEKQGIEAVNISVLNQDSTFVTGGTSDVEGNFEIKNISTGEYLLAFSHIGYNNMYKEISVSGSKTLLGDIPMQPDNNILEDVKIVAHRMVKKNDGMVIFPHKQQLKFSGSGYDLLYNIMIPGVNVDRTRGTVTRLGQEVTLYIDGQKADYREIQSIDAKSIDRIEYIDVPSGRYIEDITAINIITRRNERGSYFAVDGKQNFGYQQGSYNATAQFSKKDLLFHIFGGTDIENYNNGGSTILENYHLQNEIVERNSKSIKDIHKNNSQYVQFNLKSVTSKRTLSAKASFVRNASPDNSMIKEITYSNLNTPSITSNSLTDDKGYKPRVELYGDFKLPHEQNLSINLSGSYNKNEYSRDYKENIFTSLVNTDEDFYSTFLNMNYNKRIKNNNTFSVSLMENYRHSNSQYTGSSDYDQKLYTNETIIHLGYFHFFSNKWMLNTLLGSSWLNYKLKGEDGVSQLMPRANIMLRYMPFQQQAFTFNFNVGNSFPTINSLNTVDQAINSILVKRGNPDLEISKLYNTALMYNLFAKKFNIQAMLIGNIFTNMALPHYYTENNTIIYTYNSNNDLYQYISVVSGTYNVLENLDFKTELAILHSRIKGTQEEKQTTFRAMLDMNYSWKNFMLNLSVKAKEKRLTNSAIFEEDFFSYGANIRWSVPNWHIEVGTSNPFSKHNYLKENYNSPVYSYSGKVFSKINQRNAYVKVIYRFNHGKKQNIENSTIDKNINSAIMKVE